MAYECENFIVNIFTAIGTCSAVCVALWFGIPKKEKADGYFEIEFFENKNALLNFWINNNGNSNIVLNYKTGVFLKVKKDIKKISLDIDNEEEFIPKKTNNQKISIILYYEYLDDEVKQLYENKDTILSVFTVKGTEIELKKKK